MERKKLGRLGEDIAARHLEDRGYKIVARNYRYRGGEIDLIGIDREVLAFIEVKCRTTMAYGQPEEAITAYKRKQIATTASHFLQNRMNFEGDCRFDVITVSFSGDSEKPEINLIKNAFTM